LHSISGVCVAYVCALLVALFVFFLEIMIKRYCKRHTKERKTIASRCQKFHINIVRTVNADNEQIINTYKLLLNLIERDDRGESAK
jgi:hypothetical protein